MNISEEAVLDSPRTSDPIVLFVDDDPAVLQSIRRCFRHEPYDLITSKSGEEALGWMVEFPIDLLIADQRMPDMTGTELLRQVHRQFPDTTCAILTAYPSTDLIRQGRDAGAARILYKPWDDQRLRETVRGILSERPENGDEPPQYRGRPS